MVWNRTSPGDYLKINLQYLYLVLFISYSYSITFILQVTRSGSFVLKLFPSVCTIYMVENFKLFVVIISWFSFIWLSINISSEMGLRLLKFFEIFVWFALHRKMAEPCEGLSLVYYLAPCQSQSWEFWRRSTTDRWWCAGSCICQGIRCVMWTDARDREAWALPETLQGSASLDTQSELIINAVSSWWWGGGWHKECRGLARSAQTLYVRHNRSGVGSCCTSVTMASAREVNLSLTTRQAEQERRGA